MLHICSFVLFCFFASVVCEGVCYSVSDIVDSSGSRCVYVALFVACVVCVSLCVVCVLVLLIWHWFCVHQSV